MYESKKILALIPARAGSKGIKNKNIVDFAGKPLIYWTIQAALRSRYIDRALVSTDSQQIAQVAKESGADVPFLRPEEFAQDGSSLSQVLLHCTDWLAKSTDVTYDYLVYLQPTSPLRTAEHVDEAIEYYFKNKKTDEDTLVSVMPAPPKVGWLMEKKSSGYVHLCVEGVKNPGLRQALAEYYLPNGAIYIAALDVIRKTGSFYNSAILPFIMERAVSVDIDTPSDLQEAHKAFKPKEFQRK